MDDFSLDAMTNPALIEKRVLDSFEQYFTEGQGIVVDANNTFMFVVEMVSQLFSDSTQAIVNKLNALYRQRALTPEELYMHMSDYDYVNLFSAPASIPMELVLGKDELISNAVQVYENGVALAYKKIVIPKNTVFTINGYKFGLYYPIEIRINTTTKAFSVVYDTSSDDLALNGVNPLIQLSVNTVEYAFQAYKDINIVSLRFPVYQFEKTEYLQDISSSTGYHHTFTYTNAFYAIRIYRQVDGNWREIHQTLSDTIYDPMTVTAKIVVDSENNSVSVTIPQIYFTSGLISSQMKFEVYTTLGSLEVDITNISQEQIACVFQESESSTELSEFSKPLSRAQTIQLYPAGTKISGGSNGYPFLTLRENVVNNTFYTSVITKFEALKAKMSNAGFEVQKYQDGIMNRIFYCSKEITDLNGDTIASGSIPIHISSSIVNNMISGSPIPVDYKWVRYRSSDSSLMILPAALLRFDPNTNTSELVADSDYPELQDSIEARAKLYNKAQYTYQPFHLRVSMSNQYPVAYSYNLMAPSVDRIFFKGNNASYGESINGYTGSIIHKNSGTGGYTVRFAVTLSETLIEAIESYDVDESGAYLHDIWLKDIILYLKYSASSEAAEGCFAILSPTLEKTSDGKYLFELELGTNYFINENHYIEFDSVNQSLDGTQNTIGRIASSNRVPLQSENWTLTFLIHKDKIAEVDADRTVTDSEIAVYRQGAKSAEIGSLAADDLGTDYIAISEQQITLNFGSYMSQLLNDVDVYTGNKTYKTYASTVYATNARDVYLRDGFNSNTLVNTGALVTKSDSGVFEIGVAFQANDWILNAFTAQHALVDSVTIEDVAVEYIASTAALLGYVLYKDPTTGISYSMELASEKTVLTEDMIGDTIRTIFYDDITLKAVLLTVDNQATYLGKEYFLLNLVTEKQLCLNLSSMEDGIVAGMSIQEDPIDSSDSIVGIKKIFSPGMIISKIEGSDAVGWKLFLANKKISLDGTLSSTTKIVIDANGTKYDLSPNALLPEFSASTSVLSSSDLNTDTYQNFKILAGSPYILHEVGDNILNENGIPSIAAGRTFEYYVNAIQLDARAFIGTSESSLRKAISDLITSYAGVVDTFSPQLLERTQLYYRPMRSIGNTSFDVGNGVEKILPLQIATKFTLTVSQTVYDDDSLREAISDKILSYMESIITNNTLSINQLASMITDNLSDYVDAVTIYGFNTKEDLSEDLSESELYTTYSTQVLRVIDTNAKISIRRIVYVTDRKILATKKGLTINFVV